MNIIFFGSGAFGIPSLEALAASAHRILHVVSQPDRPAGRGKQLAGTPVSLWGAGAGLPLTRTENANAAEVVEMLRAPSPTAWWCLRSARSCRRNCSGFQRIGRSICIRRCCRSIARAAPINWAVINNDALAGVSVIEVTPRMDAGDILASASTPIGPAETAGELHDRLAKLGASLVPAVLDDIAAAKVRRIVQDELQSTRAPKLSREMAWVDFRQPAAAVSARIRGLSPWPGVQVELVDPSGKPRALATILQCQAANGRDATVVHAAEDCGRVLSDLSVACGTGALQLLTVHPQNKKPMELAAFANGYGFAPGARLRSVVAVPGNGGVTGTG